MTEIYLPEYRDKFASELKIYFYQNLLNILSDKVKESLVEVFWKEFFPSWVGYIEFIVHLRFYF